ncbi:hypothetical protein [Streptomyces sp. B93]|uniref:hypothetical protein n=1 Tax=Streptomyces sp. B93 TaxID=2824875 RepID=UPI001B35D279|nr:hypothetical protein [Streptomyces sp. B93]MBQ1090555.1 hypothetical protein [Streptomyces sp. B93]
MRPLRNLAPAAALCALAATAPLTAPAPAHADPLVAVKATYKATSVRSIEWFKGEFGGARPVENPSLKVYLLTQTGRMIWVENRHWIGPQYSGWHQVSVNQSFAENIGSACAELFEGGLFLEKHCNPIIT